MGDAGPISWTGVGGVRQDFEFQSWPLRLGVRCLTGGSDVGYIHYPSPYYNPPPY
jgi:hypothetical protein